MIANLLKLLNLNKTNPEHVADLPELSNVIDIRDYIERRKHLKSFKLVASDSLSLELNQEATILQFKVKSFGEIHELKKVN